MSYKEVECLLDGFAIVVMAWVVVMAFLHWGLLALACHFQN